jgi:hypothetical protein
MVNGAKNTAPFLVSVQAGSLGNQLFALASLQQVARGRALHLIGYEQLSDFLDLQSVAVVHQGKGQLPVALRSLPLLDRITRSSRIAGRIQETTDGRIIVPSRSSPVLLAHDVYFQRWPGQRACSVIRSRIKQEHVEGARQTLSNEVKTGETPVFLHLRRGDYLNWPSPEWQAALPESWVVSAVHRMRDYVKRPRILILSDDRAYAFEFAKSVGGATVVSGSVSHDLALMGECQAGILAASSLSWWGSTFAALALSDGPFLAPSYWIGHQRQVWFPSGISAPHLTFM